MSETANRRCVFVSGRACNFDEDEIPLEVCQLCLETWRAICSITVKRPKMLKEAEKARSLQAQRPLPVEEGIKTFQFEGKDVAERLAELDRLFAEDKVSVEEYVRQRKRILESTGYGVDTLHH
ncbi:hypothetical protein KEJ19_03380 [Candidatus Bathyarchaeota archaeon]|nr:hypothetical protein [Candidatus Bathyarchaeota archaeon]